MPCIFMIVFFDVYQEYLGNIVAGYGLVPDGTKP